MSYAQRLIKHNISTIAELEQTLVGFHWRYRGSVPITDIKSNRILFVLTAESLLRYRHLYFDCENSASWQKLIKVIIITLSTTPHLTIYSQHLRKKLDKEYRLYAQKKYILFFFKGIVGIDVSFRITNFIQ